MHRFARKKKQKVHCKKCMFLAYNKVTRYHWTSSSPQSTNNLMASDLKLLKLRIFSLFSIVERKKKKQDGGSNLELKLKSLCLSPPNVCSNLPRAISLTCLFIQDLQINPMEQINPINHEWESHDVQMPRAAQNTLQTCLLYKCIKQKPWKRSALSFFLLQALSALGIVPFSKTLIQIFKALISNSCPVAANNLLWCPW